MFLFFGLCLLAFACGESKTTHEESFPLKVEPWELSVVALGEKKTFSIVSQTDWMARSSQGWAKIVNAAGKGGTESSTLTVIVDENKTTDRRSALITVSNLAKESVSVNIDQAASDGSVITRGISTAVDLLGFARAVNGEGSISLYLVDGVVKILNDIDASSITEWIPAGTEASPLTYNVNGGGHVIKNVNWKVDVSKYPCAGFIGYAKNVTVEKLSFGDEGSRVEFVGENSGKVYAGGIAGYGASLRMEKVTNNASLSVKGTAASGDNLALGGLAGALDSGSSLGGEGKLKACANRGDVSAPVACREGGIVGYNAGTITNCSNYGTITGPSDGIYGPGWLCSYNHTKLNVSSNFGYGFVGSTPAMMKNAMMNLEEGYDLENNTVDWTLDAYYDWEEVETRSLHSGVSYHHYSCINVPRHIHVLEVNLKDPGIELCGAVADEIIPNPNGTNSPNGYFARERLSDVCGRRRSEGQKILAGINSGFFDSRDGISRGFHVEAGEPVYINNPSVVKSLANHSWSFTVFTDGTASCGKKEFSGKLRFSGAEYPFYSLNDTTMRHASPNVAPVNLYTSRYVRTPHPAYPNFVNELAANVLYVVCEYTGAPMKVNTGYASAKVIEVLDGRSENITPPYITAKNRIGIALSGAPAIEWAGIKKDDIVELRCDISIDGDASKPIYTLESAMYSLMDAGQDGSGTVTSANFLNNYDPMTFPVISEDRSKVYLVVVDGRQGWYSIGVKAYEVFRIARKLGGWWSTRMDGGGSAGMWAWNASTASGAIVSKPSDTNGERSCLTYLLIREK